MEWFDDSGDDNDQSGDQSINKKQYYDYVSEDDNDQSDDQSSGRNQYSDHASEGNIINISYIQIMSWEPSCLVIK